jgi:hypothetical protein
VPRDRVCPNHPETEPLLRWRAFADGTRHLEARCPSCGGFVGWAPQTPANVETADHHRAGGPQQQKDLFN